MKSFTRLFGKLLIALFAFSGLTVQAQSVLDPTDTLVTYNPARPPAIPAYGTPAKWVRTVRLSWNTTPYKAYIYNGCQFRLCFPKSYNPTAVDGKKYPMLIFDHGEGELGTVYDNEYSMYHGGQIFSNAVGKGTFDGYVLIMQTAGGWGTSQWIAQRAIIDYMVTHNKLDPFRVMGNGLSGGGAGTWGFLTTGATYAAGIIPMSSDAIQLSYADTVNLCKFTPIWNIHGGLDGSPAPATAQQVAAAFTAAGANYVDLDMTTQGHDTWDSTWSMPAFFPWLLNCYSSNPWTLFGQTQFCSGVAINLTLGLAPGFQAYQWRMNGTVITSATSNTLHVTTYGTYDARVERNGNWSDWSHIPAVVGIMPPTVTPPITTAVNSSQAIPDLNNNGTTLMVPASYTSYLWQKVGSTATIGTGNTLTVSTPGQYIVEVTQLHGCTSSFSPPYTVINSNGPNKPDPGSDLIATPLSSTSILLNWSQNPNPIYKNTGFEVWQGAQSGGPYTLLGVMGLNISKDTVKGLTPGTTYYYKVRALDSTAASAGSNEASATTVADTQAPTAPGSLTNPSSTNTSISLSWTAATDNIGVTGYSIYVNGVKSYSTTATTFTVGGLSYPTSYTFTVKAFDAAGNLSPASNQISAEPIQKGLPYQFYTLTPTPTSLPNFSTLGAQARGVASTPSLSPATQTTNYGFLWQGYLIVPTTGTYSFRTASVDGSKIWLGTLGAIGSPYSYTGTPIVSNDGVHSSQTVTSSSMTLTAGVYPIAIAYFHGNSTTRASLTVSWQTPSSGSSFLTIPSSAYSDAAVVNGRIPSAPTGLIATSLTYSQIGLTWADTSTVETGFEVWRSTSATTGFAIINTTGANAVSYTDLTAAASTKYYYEVRAIDQYGQSAYSAVANATTKALPAVPSTPYNLAAIATGPSSVNISWTDTTANITAFQLYRSNDNDQNFVQIATLPATATTYTDANLFSNAVYYYKLTASNAGGLSAFPTEVSVTTKDNLPVITKLANQNARYGATTTVSLTATSINSGTLAFTAFNLPPFASLTDNSNRTATLTFTPTPANAGTYTGLYVVVTDAFGGTDTTKFNLSVNNFYAPVMNTLSNVTLNEGDTLSLPLVATDQNASDALSFTAINLPKGSTLTNVSNGTGTLLLHPNYAAAGVYTVQVTANDNNGLSTTQSFVVTVNPKSPNTKIFTRFAYQDQTALGLPWNALMGSTTANLLDSSGNTTTVGLQFQPSYWWNTFNGGGSTNNNSGVYPDVVEKDYAWFGSIYGGPNVWTGTVTGTDTSQMYSMTFFANSVYNGVTNNGTTTYTVGSQTVSLSVQNNQQNTVTISNIKPNTDGTIPFSMGLGANTVLGYINAIVITKQFDDGTAPAGASTLRGQATPGKVTLSWTDSAYNAAGYQVWRAPVSTGVYSLVGTAMGNTTASYVDSNVTGHTQYSYTVRAYNAHGYSGYTDTVSLTTLNRLPKIGALANITMIDTQTVSVNVTTTDDPTTHLTLTATNLPPFATFTDNGNGTGILTVTPTAGTVGVYPNVTVTATDPYDSTAATSFTLAVTEPNVQSVYLSFTGGVASPLPWNSMTTPPFSGTTISNLVDASNNVTTISADLLDGFSWSGYTGYVTGNSDAIYPVPVVQNFFYSSTAATRRIQISGLNNAKQYNFVFFNSMWDGTNGMTAFTINGQTDSLQADWNISKTVQINGITPVNGVVTIGVTKALEAANSYINSIVIQGYDTTAGNLLSPSGLITTGVTQTTVKLQWQDRSAIETGYEVWRASDATGSYSLIASLPANTVNYTDSKLNLGANYYYIVRSVSNGSHSNYSNVLAVTTYTDAVYIAVNNTAAASAPWNNLNSPGGTGTSWSNFLDSTGAATSLSMVQTGDFAGANSLGDVTGNNSGVYPDAVLKYQYVLFAGNVGAFTLSGLNLSKKYDITFMGSESYQGGNNNTAYIVNGDTVYLNAMYNTNATVTMRGLTPDGFGNLNMSFISPGASEAGWLTSMVINGYTPVQQNAPTPPQSTEANTGVLMATSAAVNVQGVQVDVDSVISAYPNPFHQSFTLSVPVTTSSERVMVSLYDMSGKVAYVKQFDDLVEGTNYLLIAPDSRITKGVYAVRVAYASGKAAQVIQLLKQ